MNEPKDFVRQLLNLCERANATIIGDTKHDGSGPEDDWIADYEAIRDEAACSIGDHVYSTNWEDGSAHDYCPFFGHEPGTKASRGQGMAAPDCSSFRASVNHAVRAALWNFERSGYTPEELADEIADILDPPRLQSVINSRAEIEEGLRDAWKIINVLYMDALDHNGDSWPRAREWQEKWARFKPNNPLPRRP